MKVKNNPKFIEEMFQKGILLNKNLLSKENSEIDSNLIAKITQENDLLVLNEDYTNILASGSSLVDWHEIDRYLVDAEKERDDELYQSQLQHFKATTLIVNDLNDNPQESSLDNNSLTNNFLEGHLDNHLKSSETPLCSFGLSATNSSIVLPSVESHSSEESPAFLLDTSSIENNFNVLSPAVVNIIISFKNIPQKYGIENFAKYFLSRYSFLEKILRHRKELAGATTIQRLFGKTDKEKAAVIGLVKDIADTKTGNRIVTLEDPTGEIKIIISKSKSELLTIAKDLVADEVVGISGVYFDKVLFADSFLWPDIPQDHELKLGLEEEYVIFLSDLHIGSKLFLKEEFSKFLHWINGKAGSDEQKHIAQRVKYIFIAGDVVDGIGIYPTQQEELEIDTIQGQYATFVELLKQIPSHKKIIICPGNHDAVHLAEPQPAFYPDFAPDLLALPNVSLVTNPALINISKTENFSGFDVLMYHGYSFDYFIANVESIRSQGGYRRSDLIMKFLLKRRHLAPSFKSTPYFPAHPEDPLLIKTIPDFFVTGHIHYSKQANYRGVTMISGSCWQSKTSFQEKLGHEPEPARVPIVNLKTRQIKVLRFG